MGFKTKLVVSKRDNGMWRVYEPLGYMDEEWLLVVPPGFDTDFASIPRFLWSVIGAPGTGNKYTEAAVLHDYIYNKGFMSRKEADSLFLRAMKAHGVPLWRRQTIYYGVRAGGWLAWNKHRKNNERR